MEELKSTENLEREIDADARRKAEQIEKNAAQTIEKTKAEWKARLEAELVQEKERFAARVNAHKKETRARLELDKRRLAAARTERCLHEAAAAFLANCGRAALVDTVGRLVARRARNAFFGDFSALTALPPSVAYYNMTRSEVQTMLNAAFGGGVDISAWDITEQPAASEHGALDIGLVLDAKFVVIRASIAAELDEMLLARRQEFRDTLTGKELMEP